MELVNRAKPRSVALETTLLVHGLPASSARGFASEIDEIVRAHGAEPATVGVVAGRAVCGLTADELATLIDAGAANIPKANTANLGVLMHRGASAATTVSATCEIAAAAGVRTFATGGIGGVHRGYGERLDISSDLSALARFPVAVVASGVKSILDVAATREALETLGVPCVGFGTDLLPAFYRRDLGAGSGPPLDARFDDAAELAGFVNAELARTGRGVLVCNPTPVEDEVDADDWARWLREAEAAAGNASGRDATPALLAALHRVSSGGTLAANLALVRSNAALAAQIAAGMPD